MTLKVMVKRFFKDSFEILVISVLGLVGLIFIFTTPFEPPEERKKSLWHRLKEGVHEIKDELLEVRKH